MQRAPISRLRLWDSRAAATVPAGSLPNLSRASTATGMPQWSDISGASFDRPLERVGDAVRVFSCVVPTQRQNRSKPLLLLPRLIRLLPASLSLCLQTPGTLSLPCTPSIPRSRFIPHPSPYAPIADRPADPPKTTISSLAPQPDLR
ncbi:hypothetical protein NMY22_g10647 [Coprinellus aureogranulatus]|nr:hypothetical protein NMY22_g10647 [Coprinellus aureogranulatus]